jgi:hypothetical protein
MIHDGRPWAAMALALALALPARAAEKDDYDIVQYGSDCAKLIAAAPPFNCLDGEIIPITVDGRTPDTYTRHMACDRPAYLPYPDSTDGQCTPYSRVRVVRDDDIQMLLFCRRMFIRPPDSPMFDSIEIIMHNVVTGSTCFFISKNFGEDPNGENGLRVPPPNEAHAPDGFVSARALWAPPREVADHGCIFCHDSDPWMYSPWIAQTTQLPADPWGFHSVDVGGPFAAWPKPQSIRTRGNTCTGCHRIGSLNTCGTRTIPTFGEQPAKMIQSVGQAPHGQFGAASSSNGAAAADPKSAWAHAYPNSYWMPPANDLTLEQWNVIYEQDLAALQRCCADHDAPDCIVEPIENRNAWLTRMMAAHRGGATAK